MQNWKKSSLVTVIVIVVTLIIAVQLTDSSISVPSSSIDYSPGEPVSQIDLVQNDSKPKNIIIFIADGMGFSHLSLALLTQQEEGQPSVWQEFDIKGWHDARSVYGPLTDSEASATAMATGTSTQFGHIGMDPDQNVLQNIMELAAGQNYNTGIVTDSYVWDGTPAAFSAHIRNEDDARTILNQIADSQIDILIGELEDLGENDIPEKEESLEILKKRFTLLDKTLKLPEDISTHPVAAIYEEDEIQDLNSSPNLTQLTELALYYLSTSQDPFVLLVESEEMDAASHDNDSKRVVKGLQSIQETLSTVLEYSKDQGETLVVFSADHETGGLSAVADYDSYPDMQIRWSTKEHTAAVVPIFAHGPGAGNFARIHRNWEIGIILKALLIAPDSVASHQK